MFYQVPTAPVRHHVQKATGVETEERGFQSSLLKLWSQTCSTTFHYYNRKFFSWTKVSHAWSSPVCKLETFPLAICSWDGKLCFPFCPSLGSLIANSVFCLCQLSSLTVMGKCSYSKRVNRSQLQESHLCHFPQEQQGFFFSQPHYVLAKKGSSSDLITWKDLVQGACVRLVLTQLTQDLAEGVLGTLSLISKGDSNLPQANSRWSLWQSIYFFQKWSQSQTVLFCE